MRGRHAPVHPRTLWQWTLVVAIVAGLVVALGQIRAATPYVPAEFLFEGAQDPNDPASTVITCERRLPGLELTIEELATRSRIRPVGRVTSTEVVECPDAFDRHRVVFIGEVIGDVLHRRGGAWVLMNDDAYALEVGPLLSHGEYRGGNSGLSVWLEGDLADLVAQPGNYRWRGDILRVEGVVYRADPADGGGLTIRADRAEVLVAAERLRHPLHVPQAVLAGVLSLVALTLFVIERRHARRR